MYRDFGAATRGGGRVKRVVSRQRFNSLANAEICPGFGDNPAARKRTVFNNGAIKGGPVGYDCKRAIVRWSLKLCGARNGRPDLFRRGATGEFGLRGDSLGKRYAGECAEQNSV